MKSLKFLTFIPRLQQKADMLGWWGRPLLELMNQTSVLVQSGPGRAYAGASWNWGKDFDIKSVFSVLCVVCMFVLTIDIQIHQNVCSLDASDL